MAHPLRCDFCRRPRELVSALSLGPTQVAGVRPAICYDCAASAVDDMLRDMVAADVKWATGREA